MSDSVGVVWFRRDLRLADHPALAQAIADHPTLVALFVHDPFLTNRSGANRLHHLHGCLDQLDADLRSMLGGPMVERTGDPVDVVARVAAHVGASAVYVTEDFGPYGTTRDEAVEAALNAAGRTLERVGTPYVVAPDTLSTKSGTPFQVFTPFSRAWRAHGRDDPIPEPKGGTAWLDARCDERPPTPTPEATAELPEPGELAAQDALERFVEDLVTGYATDRDRPDLDRTSHLSVHLKFGTIHPRQVLAALAAATPRGAPGSGPHTFATELCWRDFYADVLHRRPETARDNYARGMDDLAWDTGPAADGRFDAWCHGQTGYPIVDAGMRQLLAEGWMHNRVRMIVASFLVKDLHIHWRRGAGWFMRHLVDGDLASNSHGWQWTAGTGTDASPFFRVFNPTSQAQRFDPTGDYVRRYVPELRHVEGKAVHEPWKLASAEPSSLFDAAAKRASTTYPDRIVDHAIERQDALDRFGAR